MLGYPPPPSALSDPPPQGVVRRQTREPMVGGGWKMGSQVRPAPQPNFLPAQPPLPGLTTAGGHTATGSGRFTSAVASLQAD